MCTFVPNAQCEKLRPQPSAHHSIHVHESTPSCHVMTGHNATGLITNHWRGRVVREHTHNLCSILNNNIDRYHYCMTRYDLSKQSYIIMTNIKARQI